MRLLVISDAGAPTGFGVVSHAIGDRLVDKGWDVHVLAANYRGDHWPTKMKLYPASLLEPKDLVGMSRIIELVGKIVPDAILIINDPHVVASMLLDNRFDPQRTLWSGFPTSRGVYRPPIVAYMPIDGYDNPRSWDILKQRVTRVAMTEFGQQAMPEASVVWHGVDQMVFKPMNRREAKRALGYDTDRFLVLRVDKNSLRKDYPATWKAMRPLLNKYADIDLHWHCLPRAFDGFDLKALMFNDENIRDRVNFSAGLDGFSGWPDSQLAVLQAAADVLISTSHGEGWGLTLGQSLACGTPVVATDCSAISEVVGPGGILVPPAGRITAPMGQDQCLPDIDGFTAAIERLYLSRGLRRKIAEAGIEHIKKANWDAAADQMDDILRAAVQPDPTRALAASHGAHVADRQEV